MFPRSHSIFVLHSSRLSNILKSTLFLAILPGMAGIAPLQAHAQSATVTTLHSFDITDGADPQSGVIQATDGNLYGTALSGGAYNYGNAYQVSTGGAFAVLHSFSYSDGVEPYAGLIQASDTNLYGATYGSNNGYGAIFRMTNAGSLSILFSFPTWMDGAEPVSSLLQAADGNLYGTTEGGGMYGYGAVYQITTGGAFTCLFSFNLSDGSGPISSLVQAADGNLYGVTHSGGAHGLGTAFQITTGGSFTSLYSFPGGIDGAYPVGGLVQASDGNLYGTTSGGGAYGYGTVFQITTGGALTTLYSFGGLGSDGLYPTGTLIQAPDGYLYGTTASGGAYNHGTLFRITMGGSLTTLYPFSGTDGTGPYAGLIQGSDGNFYGTTQEGGAYNAGTVFKVSGIYPQPVVTGLSPASVNAGGPSFILAVKGTAFEPFSTVHWNGSPLETSFVSTSELKAAVPASLIANPGTATVTVVSGAGGGTSNGKAFTILVTTLKLVPASLSKDSTTGAYTANFSLKNAGYLAAQNVKITKASLGLASTSASLPASMGNIAAGSSGSASLIFPGSAGASGTVVYLKVSGTFTGGKFSGSLKVTLP